ncbi:MAG: S8 family serine peptidase, partial [Clostridia bacterium]|nr:S8 family serine peptidase [Clostridia bacterium]
AGVWAEELPEILVAEPEDALTEEALIDLPVEVSTELEEPEVTDLVEEESLDLSYCSEESLLEYFGLEEATEGADYSGYLLRFEEEPAEDLPGLEVVLPEEGLYRVDSLTDLGEDVKQVSSIEPDYHLELLDLPEEDLAAGTETWIGSEELEPLEAAETVDGLPETLPEVNTYAAAENLPNDQYYIDGKQWNLSMVGFETAWQKGLSGKDIIIGVIDTGINANHEDFANTNILTGYNFVNDSTVVTDPVGHGTAVASLIAASTNNECGLASIASGASLVPLRIFDDQSEASVSNLIRAIAMSGSYGCKIVHMSVGLEAKYHSQELDDIIEKANKAGIILVAAVGNQGTSEPMYPASCAGVIGVGSINSDYMISNFSQHNQSVDFVAPGEGVYRALGSSNKSYQKSNGTSFAAPLVTSAIAVLLESKPGLNSDEVLDILINTATDLGDSGWGPDYGYGLVSVDKLLDGKVSNISIADNITHGSLKTNVRQAALGSSIKITAIPDSGYQLVYGSVTVNGQALATEDLTFRMGGKDVVVSAQFEPLNEAPPLEDNYYQISSASELAWFRNQVNLGSSGINAVLTQDIYLNSGSFDAKGNWSESGTPVWWAPVGAYQQESVCFAGDFDGQGHTIYGLYLQSTGNYKGLFGCVKTGTLENLAIKEVYLNAGSYSGSLAGMVKEGTVKNCSFSGFVYGNQEVGGLIGYSYQSDCSSCQAAGTVNSYYIEGKSYSDCGGIIGCFAYGNMEDCSFSGSASGVYAVGGIIGYLYCSQVESCSNQAAIQGLNYVGGISGRTYGTNTDSILVNCSNYGKVGKVVSSYVGGISGYHKQATVKNCFNLGEISGYKYLGGLVGYNYSGKIANSWCQGTVKGSNIIIGGLVGANSGSVLNCYFAGDVSGLSYTSSSTGTAVTPAPIVGTNYTGYKVSSCFWWYDGKQIVNGQELADSDKKGMGNANNNPGTSGLFSFKWENDYWKLSGSFIIAGEANNHMLTALNAWATSNAFNAYSFWSQAQTINNNYPFLIDSYQDPNLNGVFSGASFSFQNQLTVNFYIKKYLLDGLERAGVMFNDADKLTWDLAGDYQDYYVFNYAKIPAKKMGDTIRAVVFAENPDLKFGSALTYTLKDYFGKVLASAEYEQNLKIFLVDLANYGGAAQTYFNYNTSKLVSDSVKDYQTLSSGTISFTNEDYAYSITSSGKPINDFKLSLGLENKVEVYVQANSGGYSPEDLLLQIEYYDLNGVLQTWEIDGAQQNFITGWAVFDKLSAEQMDDVFRIVIHDRSGQVVSETVTYSITSYAVYTDRHSTDTKLKDLTNKMVQAGRSAARFFNYKLQGKDLLI